MELPISLQSDLRGRCAQAALVSLHGQSFDTLEAVKAELDKQYLIQLVGCIEAPARRAVVASAIQSQLPSEDQEKISDATVELTLRDLVIGGAITLVITWVEPEPEAP